MRKSCVRLATAFLLAALTFWLISCGEEDPSADSGAVDAGMKPFGIYSPGSLGSVPPESRQLILDTLGIDSYEGFQDLNFRMMQEIGTTWMRVDFEYGQDGFREPLDYIGRAQASDMEILGCVRFTRGFTGGADLSVFQRDLRDLVARYPWITIWQIGNEPNIALAVPDDYPRIFLAGSSVIRETCPSCKVMLGGIAMRYPAKDEARDYFQRMIANLAALSGGVRPFDFYDVHFYGVAGDEDELLNNIANYRQIIREAGFAGPGLELWMTETATHTGRPVEPPTAPIQTEEEQAQELVRRFVTALGNGASRVSWSRPYENYRYGKQEDGYYDLTALVYNGLGQEAARGITAGTRKQAWYAYQNLVVKLDGFAEALSYGPGAYGFSFADGRRTTYVIWDAGDGVDPRTLIAGNSDGITVTDLMGNEVRGSFDSLQVDYSPAFVEFD